MFVGGSYGLRNIICAIILSSFLGFLSLFYLMHGRKNVSGLVSFSVNFILFLMVLVVCWLWWWVSDLVVIVVLVVIRWYPLVYIYHFLCVTVIVVAVCSIATVR